MIQEENFTNFQLIYLIQDGEKRKSQYFVPSLKSFAKTPTGGNLFEIVKFHTHDFKLMQHSPAHYSFVSITKRVSVIFFLISLLSWISIGYFTVNKKLSTLCWYVICSPTIPTQAWWLVCCRFYCWSITDQDCFLFGHELLQIMWKLKIENDPLCVHCFDSV